MSDVARYVAAGDGVVKTDPAGPLVKWNDYARLQAEFDEYRKAATIAADSVIDERNHLKAEVERLTWLQVETLNERNKAEADIERLTDCQSEADRLKAEVERLRASSFVTAVPVEQYERLRNAGDAMQDRLGCKCGWLLCKGCQEAENNWEKAKEGKQS